MINKKIKGIMFHSFHDKKDYFKSEGSINSKTLENLIKKINVKNILNPQGFLDLNLSDYRKNKKKMYVFTFDDGLKSQIDIACKVLKKYKIKGFFFIFSSIFTKNSDLLEVYKHFRFTKYNNINEFYESFFDETKNLKKKNVNIFLKSKKKEIEKLREISPYYSLNDVRFRLVRNKLLKEKEYKDVMLSLFKKKNYNYKKFIKKLYMSKNDIKRLIKNGHIVGLHSHNHELNLDQKSFSAQYKEFHTNKKILEKIIKRKINFVSHPFGNYNDATLKVLKRINVMFAFKKNDMKNKFKHSLNLQIPRINHSMIIKKYGIK